jgi:hypothetical protein
MYSSKLLSALTIEC